MRSTPEQAGGRSQGPSDGGSPRKHSGGMTRLAALTFVAILAASPAMGCKPRPQPQLPGPGPLPHPYLYLDIDGTLVDGDGHIPEANLDALRAFRHAGGKVGIATGRMPDRAWPILRAIKPDLPVILANGAIIMGRDGEPLRISGIQDPAVVAKACRLIDAGGCEVVYTAWTTSEGSGIVKVDSGRCRVPPDQDWLVLKIRGRHCRRHHELLDGLRSRFGEDYLVLESGSGRYLGVSMSAAGTGKERALGLVARNMGVSLKKFAFVGDSGNDVAAAALVHQQGGRCFAVGNAVPALTRACPEQTIRTNSQGAVAEAVSRLLEP